MKLRPYQHEAEQAIYSAWDSGAENVLGVLPTGAGKTVTFSNVIHNVDAPTCAIAHRQELVTQMSLALAREGVKHRILAPDPVVKLAINLHRAELDHDFYDVNAHAGVAGVDTLGIRGGKHDLRHWVQSIRFWVQDEAHHLLRDNKWGKAVALFPKARGLGVTATPIRADKRGLGRHADGVFDELIVGPTMRELIDMGYLTDYRIFAPPSDFNMRGEQTSASGDWTHKKMRNRAKQSHIVGDVVAHYLRIAKGKLGVTFAPDIKTAEEITGQFNAAGIPAAILHGKTPDKERIETMRRFANREILQLVNVDILGEGVDVPALEVVSFARPTESYSLYVQQFGRALRLLLPRTLAAAWDTYTNEQRRRFISESEKPIAIIIDHVGNVVHHGLPDAVKAWTLDRQDRRSRGVSEGVIPLIPCPNCSGPYEKTHSVCPYCGYKPEPASRSGPEFVDGDLLELDAEALARLRGEVKRINSTVLYPAGVNAATKRAIHNRHYERQEAQAALRESIAWWAGYQRAAGRADSESYRRFYFMFGTDVLTAQTLGRREALELAGRINNYLAEVA